MDVKFAQAFDRLTREIRSAFQELANAADAMHAEDGVTASQRAVLEYLADNGSQTVPDIARAKNVSRQHIQQLADTLAASKLLTYQPNPAHKRSQLVVPTDEGRSVFRRIKQREMEAIGLGAGMLDTERLEAAADTLEKLRAALRETGLVS